MILDTSAIMAILRREQESDTFGAVLATAPRLAITAPTLVELTLVSEGRGDPAVRPEVEALLARAEVVPFTAAHAALAADGWRRFGKGRHPAALNLGDCFAYALAHARGEPLLYKGNDFARTDVRSAL